jgi:hypothetical protein
LTPQAVCVGCGASIPPRKTPGNERKWCSEKCRIWALRHPGKLRPLDRRCLHCGASLVARYQHAKYCRDCDGRGKPLPRLSSEVRLKGGRGTPLPEYAHRFERGPAHVA